MNGVLGETKMLHKRCVCAKNKVLFVLHVDILKKMLKKNKTHAVIFKNLFYEDSIIKEKAFSPTHLKEPSFAHILEKF